MCKSIARFARNTVDALKYIRELKELGIGVYFETQNIDTSTQGGDVLLIILAGIAEEESRSISKNVKWAMQKKFQQGNFMLNYTRFLGYTRDEEHNLVIVPEEAEIVKVEQEKLQTAQGLALINKRRMGEIEEYLKSINPTTEFSDEMFISLVDQVVVRNRYELEFQFKIGLKKTYKPE